VTTMTIMRGDDGKLTGLSEKDRRAYAKFKKRIEELVVGECFTLSFWFPRNAKLHKLHFAVIHALYEQQEQFSDPDDMRKWLYVGAGFCHFLPGPKGKMCAIPKSIAFDKLDDAEFSDLHAKVIDFMRTKYCTSFLWAHLPEHQAAEMIEGVLGGFEQ
jgi:hypothetical protein